MGRRPVDGVLVFDFEELRAFKRLREGAEGDGEQFGVGFLG